LAAHKAVVKAYIDGFRHTGPGDAMFTAPAG
jgi:hypothetical protein